MKALSFAVLALAASPVAADEIQALRLMDDISTVLAAEEYCGLAYDQSAIAAWVEAKVPADAMSFGGDVAMATDYKRSQLPSMTESQRTLHCTAITKSAKAAGFIK